MSSGNPFPGLRPFREGEEYLFFGRESQVDRMIDKLAATRFLAVVGTSGSGKSSLVSCGLKPALNRGLMAVAAETWHMVQFRPGASPLTSLAEAWAESLPLTEEELQPGCPSLVDMTEATLQMSSLGLLHLYEESHFPTGTSLLLVVDQFEEIFRYGAAANRSADTFGVTQETSAFVKLLIEAHAQRELPVYVVITMRSDFLGECSQFEGLPEAINEGQYLVPRMTRDERRDAIQGPIEVFGAEISPVLLTRLVNDVGGNPDQLSLLQHAVHRTWERWRASGGTSGPLLLEHYEAVGTMAGALDRHAEEAFKDLSEIQQKLCARIFRALTDTGTDSRGIRRPMPLRTLCAVCGSAEAEVLRVVDLMRSAHYSFLMPPPMQAVRQDTVIDITHEILMRVWLRLKDWAEDESRSAAIYRRLVESAALHKAHREALLGDPGLQASLDWYDQQQPNAAWARLYCPGFESAMQFLRLSKEERDAAEVQRDFQHRWQTVSTVLASLMAVLYLLALYRVFLTFKSIEEALNQDPANLLHHHRVLSFISYISEKLRQSLNIDPGPAAILNALLLFFVVTVVCFGSFLLVDAICKNAARRLFTPRMLHRRLIASQFEGSNASQPLTLPLQTCTTAEPVRPAGFWLRFISDLMDSVFLTVLGGFCVMTTSVVAAVAHVSSNASSNIVIIATIGFCCTCWLYPVLCIIGPARGTLGDVLCGLAVVRKDYRRCGFWRALGRTVTKTVLLSVFSGVLLAAIVLRENKSHPVTARFLLYSFLLGSLSYLFIVVFRRKRSLADRIMGTTVLRRRRRYADEVAA
ncbi:RDD family protein [Terriglobus roseus]|uniref:nSTAND1 domain-containing NTPase n=1 Tax=Terriglobus roseus TaxID=392734 RepID=UPI001479AFA6|nr:RDD family protein [Terriglobus roseus]